MNTAIELYDQCMSRIEELRECFPRTGQKLLLKHNVYYLADHTPVPLDEIEPSEKLLELIKAINMCVDTINNLDLTISL